MLRPRGCMVLFGGSSGAVSPLDPIQLMQKGSLFLTRPTLLNYIVTTDELRKRASAVFEMIAAGKLKAAHRPYLSVDKKQLKPTATWKPAKQPEKYCCCRREPLYEDSSSSFLFSRAEPRAAQIHARGLQLIENLPRLFVINVVRQQPCHDLYQSALHRRRILQRCGFKPSLPRSLSNHSPLPGSLPVMGIAVLRQPHGGGAAAGGVVHPVLA